MSANSTFSTELELIGKIIAEDTVCDCGHRAGAHAQYEAQCCDISEETGRPCGCPFHSSINPFKWNRRMSEIRAIERLDVRIAALLDPPQVEIYWNVVNSTNYEYVTNWNLAVTSNLDLEAAFELRGEGLEIIIEDFSGM